jgi:hypothetical protein
VCCVVSRCCAVCHGGHGAVRPVKFWSFRHGMEWRSRRGFTRYGGARRVLAVEARCGQLCCGLARSARRSRQGGLWLVWLCYGMAVEARCRKVCLGLVRSVWSRRSRRGVMWSGKLCSGGASYDNLRRSGRVESRWVMVGRSRYGPISLVTVRQVALRRSGHGPFWSGSVRWGAVKVWPVLAWSYY